MIISGILILTLDWTISDPIISMVIALLIVLGSWRLVADVIHVLLEGTPKRIDVYKLCSDIEDLEGVTIIHDVHIWTITSGTEAFTVHVLVEPAYSGELDRLLNQIQDIAHNRYGIAHVTVQLDLSTTACREDHHVGHLEFTHRPAG